MPVKVVSIPYTPRPAFLPFHNRTKRWASLVCHRRAGKTVAAVNDEIKRALEVVGPYAYIAPYRAQAKAVAWDYLKHYAHPLIDKANEAELSVKLINGSSVSLFGADNADAMRGLGFAGVYCDEYGDFRPSVWGNVIRPTLSDRKGWAVFAGTPKGHNQFYDIYRVAQSDRTYFSMLLKASMSGLIDKEELAAARAQLSQDQYDQEYECSFDAAILGAFYGVEMSRVDAEQRIREVEYDRSVPVNTAWDLGYKDDTAIWWYQNVGNEIHVLDHYAESGVDLETLAKEITERPYTYGRHWFPHDAKAKTLASGGKSIIEQMAKFLGNQSLAIVPDIGKQDGIQAVRAIFPRCYFDRKTNIGTEALRQYQRKYDEDKKAFSKDHLHNWASHSADAFRMLAVAEKRPDDPVAPLPPGKTIRTVTLDELWEWQEDRLQRETRI